MTWARIRAADKLAFREDLQADPTLTDLQKRMISVIAQNWDGAAMHAECSLTFIAAGAGCSKKLAHRYSAAIIASGRVARKRAATFTESTLWTVNWHFRGSAWVRLNNGGKPVEDCRATAFGNAGGRSPKDAQWSPPTLRGGVPQAGDQSPPKWEEITGAPSLGVPLLGATPRAPIEEESQERGNPHKPAPGFAKWKIMHAESVDDEFTAFLRSGNGRRFVLRCSMDSDDYASLCEALGLDDGPEVAIGCMVAMSTNRTGPKVFMRAAPEPWQTCKVISGESTDDGGAIIHLRLDGRENESRMHLPADDAERLAVACGGQEQAIGARVRYRLLPDDTIEFRRVA